MITGGDISLTDSNLQLRKQTEFFDGLGRDYVETVQNEYASIYERTIGAISPFMNGKILDVGSGGVDLFFSDGVYVLYDIAPGLLDLHTRNNTSFQVCGQASSLPFNTDEFDTVLFHFSIHHFAQESISTTLAYLKDVLEETKRVCKPGGTLIVAENTVNALMEYFESLVYPVMNGFLNLFHHPPVFLYSEKSLEQIFYPLKMERVCSFKEPSRLLVSPIHVRWKVNPVTIKVFVVNNE